MKATKFILLTSLLTSIIAASAVRADNQTTVLSLAGNVIGQVPPSPYVTDHPAGIKSDGTKYTFYGALRNDSSQFMTHFSRIHQTEKELEALTPGQTYSVVLGRGYMTKDNDQKTMCTSSDCTTNKNRDYRITTLSLYNLQVKYLGECVGGAPNYAHTKLWQIVSNHPYLNPDASGSIDNLSLKEGEYPSESNATYLDGTCQATTDGYIKSITGMPIKECGVAQKQVSGIYVWTEGNCATQPEVVGKNRT